MIARAHRILGLIEHEFEAHDFIIGARQTIADVALYSYVANAPEGNVDLAPYPQVRRWLTRIEALPGFVAFTKTAIGLAA